MYVVVDDLMLLVHDLFFYCWILQPISHHYFLSYIVLRYLRSVNQMNSNRNFSFQFIADWGKTQWKEVEVELLPSCYDLKSRAVFWITCLKIMKIIKQKNNACAGSAKEGRYLLWWICCMIFQVSRFQILSFSLRKFTSQVAKETISDLEKDIQFKMSFLKLIFLCR